MVSVFLSHSTVDKPTVRKIAERLSQNGIRVWIDEAEMKIGDSLIQKIGDAIENVDYVAAFISKTSVGSAWVQKELSLAMTKEIKGRHVVVLPMLIERCDLPFFLSDKLYADFTKPEVFEKEIARILTAIRQSDSTTRMKPSPMLFLQQNSEAQAPVEPYVPIGTQPLGINRDKSAFFGIMAAQNNKFGGAAVAVMGLFVMLLTAILSNRMTKENQSCLFLMAIAGVIISISGVLRVMSGIYFDIAYHHDANLLLAMQEIKGYLVLFSPTWLKQYQIGRQNPNHHRGLLIETVAVLLQYVSSLLMLIAVIMALRWVVRHG